MRRFAIAVALLGMSAATLAAQENDPTKNVADGGVKVAGWQGRVDPQAEARGAKIDQAKFVAMGGGYHVTAGPAAIYWNPANVAKGDYTVKATFTQTKAPAHQEAYGLIFAGANLSAANQSYMYFIIRGDGKYMIKHRAGTDVHTIADWTENAAVKKADENGKATNALTVVVGPQTVSFQVNGAEVKSVPRASVQGGTDGVAGLRVNHNLDVHIDGFAITPAK